MTVVHPTAGRSLWRSLVDSDMLHAFLRSRLTVVAALLTLTYLLAALLAPLIAPTNPYDTASLSLLDSSLPPAWSAQGDPKYLLGTDDQGRDILSTILYGLRISIGVGVVSVALAAMVGIALGVVAGYVGGRVDAVIMRLAEVQLAFPAILIALFLDGTVRSIWPLLKQEDIAFTVIVAALALDNWAKYARTVRGSTLVEKNRDYVQAARVIGLRPIAIMWRHVLPNVLGPVLVIATINFALAILAEATLSFLGVGFPPTKPSLGTLIRIGNNFLFSGEWWITLFPGITLALLVLAVNILGDWLRDALNPRLR
ncbi:ABC transporter permease [Candidatus Raskinella chloraquaticus]|uniref:ABC transporter permease n=1 Tax=Candidatus Raskinella chloraquaticus TaxID=1951219 RepID=A0A1W9HQD9_9HYPH|nr:MAG: ABC transporter permease [Proteobacteria bacterium SG_bin8]